jgi:protein SCO1
MKTIALFLLLATLASGAEGPAAACCKEKPDAKEAACCATPMDAAPYSARSLYQTEVAFTNDAGQPFRLGELRGRPVVLTMFFASCGYACPLLVTDMQAIRAKLPAEIRESAAFVLVSFDVERDTPAALAAYRGQRGLGSDWILLHGDDDAVRELAALLGVKYKLEAGGGFSHSNLITVLNREGEVTHQRSGLKGGLDETAAALSAIR